MKLSDLTTNEGLLAKELEDDAFRAEWERTALARAVAIGLVRHRAEHGLSQRQLAELLGMHQPQVARLESGDVNPRWPTIFRLSSRLGIEFTIDVRPAGRASRHVTKKGRDNAVGEFETDGAQLLVAVS